MSYEIRDLGPLAAAYPPEGLFATWLGEQPVAGFPTAGEELATFAASTGDSVDAPLWQDASLAQQLPPHWRDPAHRPDVVVTGQQPGYLGGPLLTLYKIATAIALAAQRTAAGRPTVPVFWSGDDDDDLVEALGPVGWDPAQSSLVRSSAASAAGRAAERTILAEMSPAVWAAEAAGYMARCSNEAAWSGALKQILEDGLTADLNWGAGQEALIERIFEGRGLVVIRGHDPRLHQCAAPFYEQLAGRLPDLAQVARERGATLQSQGFHAQINERSLNRPLFRATSGRREPVTAFAGRDAPELRPGVMLRSLVQDWLLRPVAVVVGPGELAYLKQLEPLYGMLSVVRSPLVPRLASWLLPAGADYERVAGLVRSPSLPDTTAAEGWADRIGDAARREIVAVLTDEVNLSPARASELAAGRTRRFRKGIVAMLAGEIKRAAVARRAEVPPWVLPDGRRQERTLGLLSALSLWQEDLVGAIMGAAEMHLQRGQTGAWREWAILVPLGREVS